MQIYANRLTPSPTGVTSLVPNLLTLKILIVALGEVQHCLGSTFRCLNESLAIRILAEAAQE